MASYLDFDATNSFRLSMISRTLQVPNGPQTFTSSNYTVRNLNTLSNVDPGDVENDRTTYLTQTSNSNVFKPEQFFIREELSTYQRRANLQLYPYFTSERYNLIGIMGTRNYDSESELFKFAANYIREDRNGPVFARLEQNLRASTIGRFRLADAINGNLATAINIVTGREPLIDANNKITVASTLPGKTIDFLQTVSGVEFPFAEIPGDYLSNPLNPINYRVQPRSELGAIAQDFVGNLGTLVGIQRRPLLTRKPSDLFIEYMGDGQKRNLFNLLSYSKYAPNYTTTARSQNTSATFNFIDNTAQGVKEFLGFEAPRGVVYIGDDRGNDVKYALSDFNDRPVRSPYYLSFMFDKTQAELFKRTKNINEGGQISNKLTWISKNSKNKLGENNTQYDSQRSNLEESLSNRFGFRENSILGVTQEILDTMPQNGGDARSHVGNVIDQTSRVFREGDTRISRGSAIKYVDKFSGEESGVEYCRVWTKDRPYFTMSDTMKRTANIRKFDDSVLGGNSRVWNINYGPMSNGNKGFDGSSNIVNGNGGFYAKKYMFSIENLAWKTSNREGFTVQDLPYCERGPNGGRVMWFPPYDLKISEQNSAKWEENNFLGRPEPIYTYQNTTRNGTISFKVVVDHPSVLNLLVREFFKDMSDEEADNYIDAFFAGCQDLDLYDLVRRFSTLDANDIDLIQRYLGQGVDSEVIKKYKTVTEPITEPTPDVSQSGIKPQEVSLDVTLRFANDFPKKLGTSNDFKSSISYSQHYNQIDGDTTFRQNSLNRLSSNLTELIQKYNVPRPTTDVKNDIKIVFGENPNVSNPTALIDKTKDELTKLFNELDTEVGRYNTNLLQLKNDISGGTIQQLTFEIASSTSTIADSITAYNMKLSFRRSHSIVLDVLEKIKANSNVSTDNLINWSGFNGSDSQTGERTPKFDVKFRDLGYNVDGSINFEIVNYGQNYKNDDLKCNDKKFLSDLSATSESRNDLNLNAPISFACRQTKVKFKYTKTEKQPTEVKETLTVPKVLPKTKLVEDGEITIKSKIKKPPIDVMKRLIMKTLSECYYFKKLEEDSPVVFSSLKEKLRYFHPAFHSTTPEGLNTRLTFLNQCVRPGDTIPIKGVSDDVDINARNTTFGPPPVSVLRIGDFYHSKIIIRDVNFSFEESTWDLNPEGIGVQPMIANVTLQVSFIGGQGLNKPVERLQNALSSNFYANTEMYDERSISTNKTIDGVDAEQYTKEFLEELQKNNQETVTESIDAIDKNNVINGNYIGTVSNNTLTYTNVVNDIYTNSVNYFNTYTKSYNDSYLKHGEHITSLLFSNDYRPINVLDVYETSNGSTTTSLELLGIPTKGKELNIYLRGLKTKLVNEIENDISSLSKDVFGFKISENKIPNSDLLLKPQISSWIQEKIDNIVNYTGIKDVEESRNKLVSSIDKGNYLVYYTNHDGKVEGEKYTSAVLSGFTSVDFYNKYGKIIDFVNENHSKLTQYINTSVDFKNPSTITQNQAIEMILILLQDKKNDILNLYTDRVLFREKVEMKEISKSLDNKLKKLQPKEFKIKKSPIFDGKTISFSISSQNDITDTTEKDVLKKINSKKVLVTNKLNYFKSGN